MVRAEVISPGSDPAMLRGAIRILGTSLRTSYKPAARYLRPVRMVFVEDLRLNELANSRAMQDTLAAWKGWAPQLTSWNCPGDHFSSLKSPHVQVLAGWWRYCVQADLEAIGRSMMPDGNALISR